MRRSRFSEEPIVGTLKEAEAGAATAAVCRQHDISEQTLSRWKRIYGGLDVSHARRLKALEEENTRLKHLVGDH